MKNIYQKNCVDYHGFTEILENFGRSLQKKKMSFLQRTVVKSVK